MVESVTNQSLGDYMQEHIWGPLGMTSTTFRLHERLDIKARRADMSTRNDDGSVGPSSTRWFSEFTPDDHGGGGVYSCVADYVKVLASLIKNDGILLSPANVDLLFTPCLTKAAAEKFQAIRSVQNAENDRHEMALPAPVKVDYALGGMTTLEDIPGGRKAGSMSWGGLPNLSWVLDRTSGIGLFFASQLIPPGDAKTQQMIRRFEAAVYSGEFFTGASQL